MQVGIGLPSLSPVSGTVMLELAKLLRALAAYGLGTLALGTALGMLASWVVRRRGGGEDAEGAWTTVAALLAWGLGTGLFVALMQGGTGASLLASVLHGTLLALAIILAPIWWLLLWMSTVWFLASTLWVGLHALLWLTVGRFMSVEGLGVAVGYIASLGRPGGNVTGLTGLPPEVTAKRMELLKGAVPGMTRVAVLRNPDSPDREILRSETEAAATALRLQLQALDLCRAEDIDGAFQAATEQRAEGLVVLRDPLTNTNRPRIVALAAQHRLPAIYASDEFVKAGGLMFYGANVEGLYRRLGVYVDKILKGAKPADLPVERATELDFIINLKVAQDLGLTIPQSVLLQATEVIE